MTHSTSPRRSLAAASLSAAVLAGAGQAQAAPVYVKDISGNLLGINGLTVSGQNYNVMFMDGSCTSLYGGCSPNTNSFMFTDTASATAATTALRGALGAGVPGQILGCGTVACGILTDYFTNGTSVSSQELLIQSNSNVNSYLIGSYSTAIMDFSASNGFNTNTSNVLTQAFWVAASPSATDVPEPATLALAAVGLGAAFMARGKPRRRVVGKG